MIKRRDFLQLSALALAAMAATPGEAQRPVPKSEYDYVDWSWRRWRQITGQKRPTVSGAQSGKGELIYLHEENVRTLTPEQWQQRRGELKRLLTEFLGTPPAQKPPLAPKVLEETELDGYTRRRLTYQTELGEHVPAYLLIPKKMKGRVPAMLCPHQTTTPLTSGKNDPGRPERRSLAVHGTSPCQPWIRHVHVGCTVLR